MRGEAFAGEYEPMTVAILPLRDLGKVHAAVSDLAGESSTISAAAIDLGLRLVSDQPGHVGRNRLHDRAATDHAWRRRGDAARAHAAILDDGQDAGSMPARGCTRGRCRFVPPKEATRRAFRSNSGCGRGNCSPVDIPAGPFGYTTGIPWFGEDAKAAAFNQQMSEKKFAENARLWLHGLQRAAVDRVRRVQPGQAGAGFQRRLTRR